MPDGYALKKLREDVPDPSDDPNYRAAQDADAEAKAGPNRRKANGDGNRKEPPDKGDGGGGGEGEEAPPDLTEDQVALAFAERHAGKLLFCHTAGAWYSWTGAIWIKEETRLAYSWARDLCREFASGDGSLKARATLGRANTSAGVERFAQSDRAFAVTSAVWDKDIWLLGTPGGTVNLRTGELRPADPADRITRSTAIAPTEAPDCPQWLAFLEQVTGGDHGLIRFLRQWSGYCLSGDVSEQSLVFCYGPGGNGKGVFLNTVFGILGTYARMSAMETFVAAQGDRHPTDLAMLAGARMVGASETEEGRAWAEVRIKAVTGGDVITARFMRRDFFEFKPQFKLTIIGNHKPVLRSVDEAARRRFNIVPFNYKPPEKDKKLEDKLRAEWPAILRWMIEGCLDWQMNGLVRPQVILDATTEYFEEQDSFTQWLEECCELQKDAGESNASLWLSWTGFAKRTGAEPGSAKALTQHLERLGCRRGKDVANKFRGRGLLGIKVRVHEHTDQGDGR